MSPPYPQGGYPGSSSGAGMPRDPLQTTQKPMSPALLRRLGSLTARFPAAYDAEELRTHVFRRATPDLFTDEDLERFLSGRRAEEFVAFLLFLNERVTGVGCGGQNTRGVTSTSTVVNGMVALLRRVASYVDEIPPLDHTEAPNIRFGNPAFRAWIARLEGIQDMIKELLLGTDDDDAARLDEAIRDGIATELGSYFVESFGNSTRIDYGTGHETCFVAMLFCMAKIGMFKAEDARDIVLVVFKEYLTTVRLVQRVYCLEPAGTRGVWGLDDYQILPFLWGSAQLIDHPSIRPSAVTSMVVVTEHADEFLYLGCVKFIRDIKQGPFHETSPMLFDISGVESWRKINGGMIKMYCAELLAKRTIMQHFLIGSVITM
jgi:serine/threonine-protein phosphatase 2A activator